jgi:hypothetical protein
MGAFRRRAEFCLTPPAAFSPAKIVSKPTWQFGFGEIESTLSPPAFGFVFQTKNHIKREQDWENGNAKAQDQIDPTPSVLFFIFKCPPGVAAPSSRQRRAG